MSATTEEKRWSNHTHTPGTITSYFSPCVIHRDVVEAGTCEWQLIRDASSLASMTTRAAGGFLVLDLTPGTCPATLAALPTLIPLLRGRIKILLSVLRGKRSTMAKDRYLCWSFAEAQLQGRTGLQQQCKCNTKVPAICIGVILATTSEKKNLPF